MYRRIPGNVLIVLVCLTAATFYIFRNRILPTSIPEYLTHPLASTATQIINLEETIEPATITITETAFPIQTPLNTNTSDSQCPPTTLSLTTTLPCTCPSSPPTPIPQFASPSEEIASREQAIIARLRAAGIIIVFKTGAQEVSQLAIQLGTTLRYLQPSDILFFSDLQGSLGPFIINDALRNVDQSMKTSDPDFEIYRKIRDFQATGQDIRELTENMGKGDGRSGWRLDKYKFLHMVEETYEKRPDAKWYVFIETDSYVFWDNLVSFLERFDSSLPMYLGSAVRMGGVTFAHGGSGYVLSNAAMTRLLGPEQPQGLASSWDKRMKGFCCGDVALATALQEKGVIITVAHPLLNGYKPSTFTYGTYGGHWCQPVVTMHHVVPHEISAVWRFERRREVLQDDSNTTIFEDLYQQFVEPHLTDLRENWDNLSHGPPFTEPTDDEKKAAKERLETEKKKQEEEKRKKEEKAKAEAEEAKAKAEEAKAKHEDESAQKTENAQEDDGKAPHEKGEDVHQQREEKENPKEESQHVKSDSPKTLAPRSSPAPWESLELCRAECEHDKECFQYVYIEQPNSPKQCKLGKSFRLGKYLPPAKDGKVIWTSGWMVERIRKWTKEHACKGVEWPDIKAA